MTALSASGRSEGFSLEVEQDSEESGCTEAG